MVLGQELATDRASLPGLVSQEGKFVLIHGDDVAGTFTGYEDALRQGYREFGLEPLLVKKVRCIEPVLVLSRAPGTLSLAF